jgi:hypothetical protein
MLAEVVQVEACSEGLRKLYEVISPSIHPITTNSSPLTAYLASLRANLEQPL